jgi:hypothetical protein
MTELFTLDPQIVSVGITRMRGDHGFRVVRQRVPGVRTLHELDAEILRVGVRGVPVELREVAAPLRPQLKLPASSLGPSASQRMLAEQGQHRPICAGLQLQNFDCDLREGLLACEQIEVGSLGMLLEHGNHALLLSNNHVLAGQNRGQLGDRISQPGGGSLGEDEVVARLERFVELRPSPVGAHPRWGNVVWNRVDAAIAQVSRGVDWQPGFLPHHRLPRLRRPVNPVIGDEVFKVGRTTGLRRGRIVSVSDRVGPVGYALGECWFRDSFVVESVDGRPFSEGGDSGAVIVRGDGEIVGLIYAGNGVQTYGCPINDVLGELRL